MRVGNLNLALDIPDAQLLTVHRQAAAPPIGDVSAAVRAALEHPLHYPALRQALTPDDHVAILVDETLGDFPRLLMPLLEHLLSAHITPDAVTLLFVQPGADRAWLE